MRTLWSFFVVTCICIQSVTGQDEKILPVAQIMPTLESCADIADAQERRICHDKAISEYFRENLKYPSAAKEAGVEGHVIVRFVVDEKGKLDDFTVDEDPGYGMAEEAIRLVKKVGKWSPGRNHEKPVKVRLAVPVKFELDDESPEPVESKPDVYVIADPMPQFNGCGDMEPTEARQCTFEKVLAYTQSNLKYPESAKKQNITGEVIVKFVVNTDGSVMDAHVTKGIGGGCDEEALRVVKSMPSWTPGMVDGQRVKVEMTLPFRFIPTENE